MAIIDPDGLFHGDRLGKCSDQARLYWPFLFLASNGFGRLELNYQRITAKVFASFDTPPTESEVFNLLREYQSCFLLFVYSADGQLWGQWDTSEKNLPRHKTSADKRSPSPPVKEFRAWRDDYVSSKSSKVIDLTSLTNSPEKVQKISEDFREDARGVGVGIGVGVGGGDGKTTAPARPAPSGTRLPHDFQVTPEHRYFALSRGLPAPDDHIEEFRDYWMAKPGSAGKKLDWDATFRGWLRRAKEYAAKAGGSNGGTRASQRQKSSLDAIAAAVDRANQRATGGGNGSHEGSLHQPGPAGGNAGRDDAGLESPDSGVRRKDVQASVIESQATLQILPNHSRDKGVLRSGIERIPAPVGSG